MDMCSWFTCLSILVISIAGVPPQVPRSNYLAVEVPWNLKREEKFTLCDFASTSTRRGSREGQNSRLDIEQQYIHLYAATMSFTTKAIKEICAWGDTPNNEATKKWTSLSNDQVARRICRYAEVPTSTVLASEGCLEALCGSLCDQLLRQVLVPSVYRLKHQMLYAALWAYILPAEGWSRPRANRVLWQMQMCIGVCTTVANLREVGSRACLRQVLRMLPGDVQHELHFSGSRPGAMYHFVANNFRLLRGQVETKAILYVGLHARSRCWYVGRTTTNRTRGHDV